MPRITQIFTNLRLICENSCNSWQNSAPTHSDDFHFGNVKWQLPFSETHNLFHINRLEDFRDKLSFPLPPHRKTVYDLIFLTQGESSRSKVILEIATIDIKSGTNADFESNLKQAQSVISQSEGYLSHEFHHCIEQPNRYILLIKWTTVEAHTEGFRKSELFKQWRGFIGQFFDGAPLVQHYNVAIL